MYRYCHIQLLLHRAEASGWLHFKSVMEISRNIILGSHKVHWQYRTNGWPVSDSTMNSLGWRTYWVRSFGRLAKLLFGVFIPKRARVWTNLSSKLLKILTDYRFFNGPLWTPDAPDENWLGYWNRSPIRLRGRENTSTTPASMWDTGVSDAILPRHVPGWGWNLESKKIVNFIKVLGLDADICTQALCEHDPSALVKVEL